MHKVRVLESNRLKMYWRAYERLYWVKRCYLLISRVAKKIRFYISLIVAVNHSFDHRSN